MSFFSSILMDNGDKISAPNVVGRISGIEPKIVAASSNALITTNLDSIFPLDGGNGAFIKVGALLRPTSNTNIVLSLAGQNILSIANGWTAGTQTCVLDATIYLSNVNYSSTSYNCFVTGVFRNCGGSTSINSGLASPNINLAAGAQLSVSGGPWGTSWATECFMAVVGGGVV